MWRATSAYRVGFAAVICVSATAISSTIPSASVVAAPPTPILVDDVNTDELGSFPAALTVVGATVFFIADDGVHGTELWKYEGGTATMVADIEAGPAGSNPTELLAVGSDLYFVASRSDIGQEVWVTDGTTVTPFDIRAGASGSSPSWLTEFDGDVYFSATTTGQGAELWRLDIATGTTTMLDLYAGLASASPSYLTALSDATGDILYFRGNDATSGNDLRYVEAGSSSIGTIDIRPDAASSNPYELTRMGAAGAGYLYLVANDGSGGDAIHRVARTAPATFTSVNIGGTQPAELTRVGDHRLFLRARDSVTSDEELYGIAGFGQPIALIADINPLGSSSPLLLTAIGSRVYFRANDGTNGSELWSSDGTQIGTTLHEINSGAGSSDPFAMTALGGQALAFVADDGVNGRELWFRVDAASAPVMVDLETASAADPVALVRNGSTLFLQAFSRNTGAELYSLPIGPSPSYSLAANIRTGTESSLPSLFRPIGDRVFAVARSGVHGSEPVILDDGVPAALLDFTPQTHEAYGDWAANAGDRVVFTAGDSSAGEEPWVTDGTPSGTVRLADLHPGSGGSAPTWFAEVGTRVVFAANDGTRDRVYTTDGTPAGTVELRAQNGAELGVPRAIVADGDRVLLAVDVAFEDAQLWTTDGTQAGTRVLLASPTRIGDVLPAATQTFVTAFEPGRTDFVLWRTDDTVGGTIQLDPAGADLYDITMLGASADRLYFTAFDDVSGETGLWTSDGTQAGTKLVRVDDATFVVDSDEFAPLPGGKIVFTGNGVVDGSEPWVSDGTPAGTKRLADLFPGPESSEPVAYEYLNGWVYFGAYTLDEGGELYRTDGSAVEMIPPTSPGTTSSVELWQEGIEAVGDRLYWSGHAPGIGEEPHSLDLTPAKPAAPTGVAAVAGAAGSGRATVSWTATADVPGAPVTGYTVTSSPGGKTCSTTGSTSCTVSGLVAGTSYRFTVVATNRIGSSPASSQSNAVTPAAAPTPPAELTPLVPARLLETRSGSQFSTVDGLHLGVGPVGAGKVYELPVVGRGGVPSTAGAVMLNVTAVRPAGSGYLTVFPCGESLPNASNVNYVAGQVVPNAVLAKVGAGGKVCVFTFAESHLLVDVTAAW